MQGVAGAVKFLRAVAHRLAMGAYGGHVAGLQLAACQQIGHHCGIDPHQCIGRQGGAVQFVVTGGIEGQEFSAKCVRERPTCAGQHHGWVNRVSKVREHAVHAIERSARHQADEQLARLHRR